MKDELTTKFLDLVYDELQEAERFVADNPNSDRAAGRRDAICAIIGKMCGKGFLTDEEALTMFKLARAS